MAPRARFVPRLFLILLAGFPATAAAEPISFTFTSTLTFVGDAASSILGVDLHAGDSFSGSLSFAPGSDTAENPSFGSYPGTGNIQTTVFGNINMSNLSVLNDLNVNGDVVSFAAFDQHRTPAPGYNGLLLGSNFEDPSGATLTSDRPPDLSTLRRFPGGPFRNFNLITFVDNDDAEISVARGTIQLSGTPAPTPEPATLFLCATGAVAVGRR